MSIPSKDMAKQDLTGLIIPKEGIYICQKDSTFSKALVIPNPHNEDWGIVIMEDGEVQTNSLSYLRNHYALCLWEDRENYLPTFEYWHLLDSSVSEISYLGNEEWWANRMPYKSYTIDSRAFIPDIFPKVPVSTIIKRPALNE